jgi:hypothetical protein
MAFQGKTALAINANATGRFIYYELLLQIKQLFHVTGFCL